MTISLNQYLTSDGDEFDHIDLADLAYFRERLRNRLHELMLDAFEEKGMPRCTLARLMHKRPEQVTRLLGSPGNLTLDTVSDFFIALGLDIDVATSALRKPRTHNYEHELAAFMPTTVVNAGSATQMHPRNSHVTQAAHSPNEMRVTKTVSQESSGP